MWPLRPRCGIERKIENEHVDYLISKIEEDPLLDLNDLKVILAEKSIHVDKSTISLHLKHQLIYYKKYIDNRYCFHEVAKVQTSTW